MIPWDEMERRFRGLEPALHGATVWLLIEGEAASCWGPAGEYPKQARRDFEALAEIAGQRLSQGAPAAALEYWYRELASAEGKDRWENIPDEHGFVRRVRRRRVIDNPAGASARRCVRLAAQEQVPVGAAAARAQWLDLGDKFQLIPEPGDARLDLCLLMPPMVLSDRQPSRWRLVGAWGGDARSMFEGSASTAGRKLIEAGIAAKASLPWANSLERWYAFIHEFSHRAAGFGGSRPDPVGGSATPILSYESVQSPVAASVTLCLHLATLEIRPAEVGAEPVLTPIVAGAAVPTEALAGREPAPIKPVELPALDRSGIEETMLRYLAPQTIPRSLHDIARNNAGQHERPVCRKALGRLVNKGYVTEPNGPSKGWAATDNGKEWVRRNPKPK